MKRRDKQAYSRRNALAKGIEFFAVAGAGLALSGSARAQASKMSQKVAGYQGTPKDGHHCSICAHFQAPHSCNIVEGNIDPNGWCRLYSPKVSY